MTREELLKTHPHHAEFIDEWRFYIRAYFGGKMYREGHSLLQRPFESSPN